MLTDMNQQQGWFLFPNENMKQNETKNLIQISFAEKSLLIKINR